MSQKQKRILIGLLGTIGSGKTIVSDYLVERHGFFRVMMGDLVREKAKEEGLELTRENLQYTQKKYRGKFGQEYFIKENIKRLLDSTKKLLLIDGIRTPVDAKAAKENDAVLILVDAPPKIRFERLKARKREGDAQTFIAFKKQEEREWKLFNLKESFKHVDYRIENTGTIQEMHKKIDNLLDKKINKSG